MYTTIKATKTNNGYKLTDENGKDAQEGYEYPNKEKAMEAAKQLWPANSVWKGKAGSGGWKIKID